MIRRFFVCYSIAEYCSGQWNPFLLYSDSLSDLLLFVCPQPLDELWNLFLQ